MPDTLSDADFGEGSEPVELGRHGCEFRSEPHRPGVVPLLPAEFAGFNLGGVGAHSVCVGQGDQRLDPSRLPARIGR